MRNRCKKYMRKPCKGVLLASVSGVWAALALAVPAAAQEVASSANDAGGLEEILVTAQRREEGAQDVPVSLSVVSESMTKALGISDTSSLQAAVPGLQFTRSLNSATPTLRGIGTNPNIQTGDEPTIATYVDGVYLSAPSAAIFSFNNIKQIEVLKGPQGTLFGRNATGGVIQIITKDPQHDLGGNFEFGYSNYDTISANAYLTGGLGDDVAADLAVYYSDQGDGWGKNLFDGRDVFKTKEYGARTKWVFTPGDNTKITISGDYNYGHTDVGVKTHPYPGTFYLDGATTYAGFYNVDLDYTGYAKTRQIGGSIKLEQDLSWAKLVSISAYRNVKSFVGKDGDQTPLPLLEIDVPAKAKTFTQEVQLLSQPDSAIQWIIGAYYLRDISKFDTIHASGLALQAQGLQYFTINNKQWSSSYAAFGQATAEVLPNTNLTLGARYTVDRRHAKGVQDSDVGVLAAGDDKAKFPKVTWKAALDHHFGENILGYASYSRGFKSGVYNLISPGSDVVKPEVLDAVEVGVKTDLFDNKVRFNIAGYYNWFKNLQVSVIKASTASLINAASSKSYGLDVDLQVAPTRNFRIMAAASYIHSIFSKFEGAQVTTPNGHGNTIADCDANPDDCDVSGNDTPRAPKWTANLSGQYTINRDEGDYTLSLGYYYNDGYFWEAENRIRNPSYHLVNGSISYEAAESGLTARLWVKNLLKEKYYIFSASSAVGDEGSPAAPRTYGITLGYHF